MSKIVEEERSNTRWQDWIGILLKIVSIVSIIFVAYLGHSYSSRVASEQRIKEIAERLAPAETPTERKNDFIAYTLLRFQFSGKKASKDESIQKLLAQQIFTLILQEKQPDIYNPKDRDMLLRIRIVEKAISDTKSEEVFFAEILFQKENKRAILEFENFIQLYPNHWVLPWAYFNIASIYSVIDPPKALEYGKKALNEARNHEYEDGEIDEMAKRLKKRVMGFKGE